MSLEALDLNRFKEFDSKEADRLFLQVRVDLSKERPDGKAYLWIKKNKPRIFARAVNFSNVWAIAVDACDMKAVKFALIGLEGAWLHGFREYRERKKK